MFGKWKLLFLRQYIVATELGRLCTEMEIGMDKEVINEIIHIATQKVGYMYLKKDVQKTLIL